MNKLEEITNTCEYVMQNAKHVKINEEAINDIIKNWNEEEQSHWLSSNPFGLLDLEIEEIVNFLIIFDSIVFSFWGKPKWTLTTVENEKIDGSFALIYALRNLYKQYHHLDFTKITEEEFKNVLKGNVEIPLLQKRFQIAREVSEIINKKMNSNFYVYTKKMTKDTDLFHFIVDNFPTFEDERTYNGKTIFFYKLAQLVTSDILHIRALKENIRVDCSHLVGCADYKIPQSLRNLHIVEYDEELSRLVDNLQEIEENSIYEVEIRASMIVAIKKIKEGRRNKTNAIDINDTLWVLGQDKSKSNYPYHRTRTTSY